MSYAVEWQEVEAQSKNKKSLRNIVRHTALSALGIVSRPDPVPSLRLLYLHNVFDDQVAEFEKQVKYLSGIGKFLNADGVMDIINGKKPLDQCYFHLSFDDGFRNIITNALPVLQRYDLPATFFVPTKIISCDYDRAERFCREVTNYPCAIEIATWDELGRAQESGLEIASHTRTHIRFTEASKSMSKMEDEIFGSKEDIERELNGPCKYISWPYGQIGDADVKSLEAVKKAEYTACFGAFRGQIVPKATDPFYIPRHHIEAHWPLLHVKYFSHGGMEKS